MPNPNSQLFLLNKTFLSVMGVVGCSDLVDHMEIDPYSLASKFCSFFSLHTIVEPDFLDPHDFLDAPKNSILQKVGN
jgi:hypothetical protein